MSSIEKRWSDSEIKSKSLKMGEPWTDSLCLCDATELHAAEKEK